MMHLRRLSDPARGERDRRERREWIGSWFLIMRSIGIASLLVALSLSGWPAVTLASAGDLYSLDQRSGSVVISVAHLGMFSTEGRFRKFSAHLDLNLSRPETASISMTINAASIDTRWQAESAVLRSPDFLDVQKYPNIRFTSTSVDVTSPNQYLINGILEIRGVKRPFALDTRIRRQPMDTSEGVEIANLFAHGALQRSAFGMTAHQMTTSDRVDITIRARIQIRQRPAQDDHNNDE
jgi:polyisoprenoid-binding protein YceI